MHRGHASSIYVYAGGTCMLTRTMAALTLVFTLRIEAQQAGADKQQKIAALKQAIAQDQAALKQYKWTETTQTSMKGEVKKTEQKACQYGPDGKVQKTPISSADQPAPKKESKRAGRRGGAVKEAIVENKVEDLKEYMQQVGALVKEYVPPDGQKIQAAAAAGNLSVTPAGGLDTVQIKDYAKTGDMLSLGFDPTAKKLRSYKVQSYLKDKNDAVTLDVTFAQLPGGPNHVEHTVLNATAKKILVDISNSGYAKIAQ